MITELSGRKIYSKYKSYIFIGIKLFVTAGILFYLISYIDYREIINAFSEANAFLIAAAFFLSLVNIYLQFLKWKLTCITIMSENNNSKILSSIFFGLSAGAITPLRIGEYFGRAIAFKNKPLIQVTTATLVDKFFPLLIITFLGSVSCLAFIYIKYDIATYIVFPLFIVVFTIFYFFLLMIRSKKFWENIFFNKLRNSNRFSKLLIQLTSLRNLDNRYTGKMTFISMLFYICFLGQYAILVAAFSHNSYYLNYLWAGNLIIFVKTVIPQFSLGELGIREGASVFFLTSFGELPSVAFDASISLFFINILIPSLVGLFLFLRKNND